MHNLVPESVFVLLFLIVFAVGGFVLMMWKKGNLRLIHKIYFVMSGVTIVWLIAIMSLIFIDKDNTVGQWIVDCMTNIGAFLPVLVLLVAFVFIKGWAKMPRWVWLLFVIPTVTLLMVWTNPLHHFYYTNFSLYVTEVQFGWYFYIHSVYTISCTLIASFLVLRFAFKNRSRLYMRQATLFALGNVIPIIVNIVVVNDIIPSTMSIVTTPLSYIFGVIVLHGIAIFKFHMLDIKPMAVESVLNWITDGYLVLGDDGLVLSFNKAFADTFGKEYNIRENQQISKSGSDGITDANMGLHTLLTSIDACKNSNTTISYEQALVTLNNDKFTKKYYMVDISPLEADGSVVGFLGFFKDVTKLRESMQRVQQSQAQMMERDRLASLGQMVGGIAHNLKTPIMGIAGSTASINSLITESEQSLGDDEVTESDYREIYDEMRSWTKRITEACAYMSDIITAVKGQAASMNTNQGGDFDVADLHKRVSLLLRHELIQGHCTLTYRNLIDTDILIHGDINNLVQVVNNLVVNAIDATRAKDGGEIVLEVDKNETHLMIKVIDNGSGISEDVKKLLFRQMVTDKGAMGTGLGIFMSNSSIKANFGGTMWFKDNPEGGTIFGIDIPLDYVSIGRSIYADGATEGQDEPDDDGDNDGGDDESV